MNKTRRPNKMFWISLLIPLLVLTSMLIKPVSTLINGEEITLATIPIDPRDLFYGDYVILDLEIETIDVSLVEPSLKDKLERQVYTRDIPVYVSLQKKKDGIHRAIFVSDQKPLSGLFVKGKMAPYIHDNSWNDEGNDKETVRIEYGIERFYVEEGTGLKLEDAARKGKVLVSVKIHNGYPLLLDINSVQPIIAQ